MEEEMAQWQRCLDIKDVWASEDVRLIARTLSERLRKLEPFGDEALDGTRDELARQFGRLAKLLNADADEFDQVMEMLYDWADTKLSPGLGGKKACWVAAAF